MQDKWRNRFWPSLKTYSVCQFYLQECFVEIELSLSVRKKKQKTNSNLLLSRFCYCICLTHTIYWGRKGSETLKVESATLKEPLPQGPVCRNPGILGFVNDFLGVDKLCLREVCDVGVNILIKLITQQCKAPMVPLALCHAGPPIKRFCKHLFLGRKVALERTGTLGKGPVL